MKSKIIYKQIDNRYKYKLHVYDLQKELLYPSIPYAFLFQMMVFT